MPFPNKDTQFKKGQSGNPAGMPKGIVHISTHIQRLMEDEAFEANILDAKTGIREYRGAPVQAIIQVAITKAVNGDDKAREWLAKYGWSQRIETDITTGGDKLEVGFSAEQAEQLIRIRASRSDI